MTDYTNFEPEEFAKDAYFIQWVCHAEIQAEEFWQNWLETFPYKKEDVAKARQMVLLITNTEDIPKLSGEEILALRNSIFERINEKDTSHYTIFSLKRWIYIAASIIGIVVVLGWSGNRSQKQSFIASVLAPSESKVLIENTEENNKMVNLPDGSTVLLAKHSSISYSDSLSGSIREIYLEGEGFFEVAKMRHRPFFVHAGGIVTKVLGTSFKVSALPTSNQVKVLVKTGKVAVFKDSETELAQKIKNTKLDGLVLNPSEEIVYHKENEVFKRVQQATVPKIVSEESIEIMEFEYEEVALSKIFLEIEKAYNVDIVYDSTLMGECPVTASIIDEPFLSKLSLITKAVRSQYQIIGNTVFITGQGCK